MPEKRVLPLNNPVSPKSVHQDHEVVEVVVEKDRGVSQGGKEKTRQTTEEMVQEYREMCQRNEDKILPVYMLLRCRQCSCEQQITFASWKPPKWHRCIGCRELQPAQGYAMISYANSPLG